MSAPWLSLVGIGEDGRAGLSPAALAAVRQARLVVGGRRHLALAGPLDSETLAWPSPLTDALPAILARRGTPVCVLASGDPFFHGVGKLLAEAVPVQEMACWPAPSSFSLAAARLGWSLQDCRLVSLHGRDVAHIVPHLQPRAKLLCLTWDETTPGLLAELMRARRLGRSKLHLLEAIGGPRERIRTMRVDDAIVDPVDPLNIVAIEVVADPDAALVSIAPGLPDDIFERDNQLTKREIRAVTLSALRPFRGGHLWDVGAGSGSIAIEWARLDAANRASAIELRADRAAGVRRNAISLGVPDIAIVTGRAPEALDGLPSPDSIFIGGGAGDPALVAACWDALAPGGRLVVNAVTIETQARLIAEHAARGGDLVQIAVAHADPVGRFHGWRPAMPVTQWAVTKP